MWKTLIPLYTDAYKRSTSSGQHSNVFLEYCNGRLDVAYLHLCVGKKSDLARFVRGGMPDATKMDSTKPWPRAEARPKRTRREYENESKTTEADELRTTLKLLTNFVARKQDEEPAKEGSRQREHRGRDVLEILDCMSKSYAIMAQLRATASELDSQGRPNPMLQTSIRLQEAGLRQLEQEYAQRMGIQQHKRTRSSTQDDEEIICV